MIRIVRTSSFTAARATAVADWGGHSLGPRSSGRVVAAATRKIHQDALQVFANAGRGV